MTAPEHPEIRSVANPTVKHLVRLRDNRTRRRLGRVIVDGWRETSRAVEGGLELCGLYLPSGGDDADVAPQVLTQAAKRGLIRRVSSVVMEKISYGQSPRSVVAEFVAPDKPLSQLQLSSCPLILVLDQIEKPGNIGAVFRCADAAGVDAVILTDADSDLFNPNAIRSSLGAVFVVPAAVATEAETRSLLTNHQIRPLAAGRIVTIAVADGPDRPPGHHPGQRIERPRQSLARSCWQTH